MSLKHWELAKFFVSPQQYLPYILDYALPQVPKLSRSLQAEKIDLTAIAPLVDATLNTLDDAILPAANWVLELLDTKDDLEVATDIKITTEGITSFQDRVANPSSLC